MTTLPVGEEVGLMGAAVGIYEGASIGTAETEGTPLGKVDGWVEYEGAMLGTLLGRDDA